MKTFYISFRYSRRGGGEQNSCSIITTKYDHPSWEEIEIDHEHHGVPTEYTITSCFQIHTEMEEESKKKAYHITIMAHDKYNAIHYYSQNVLSNDELLDIDETKRSLQRSFNLIEGSFMILSCVEVQYTKEMKEKIHE